MCIDAKVQCKFEILPWARAYQIAQQQPLAGLVSTARIAQREELFKWVGPLASSRNFFYRLKSNERINPRDLAEVKEHSLCVVRNSIYENFVETIGFIEGKNLLKVSHTYECINLFFKNKIDLLIGSDLSFGYQVMQYGLVGREVIKLVELPLNGTLGNYLALNNAIPIDVLKRFQASYQKLLEQGLLEEFINQYSTL